jgi:hypothetical protein
MARIFISYRHDDAAAHANLLRVHLTNHFGQHAVFMDVNKRALPPGADWPSVLEEEAESCDALLAVIGPRWLKIEDAVGKIRILNPYDVLRAEIRSALQRDAYVVPVLVGGAPMPQPDELPEDLSRLARIHALVLHDDDTSEIAIKQLIEAIETALKVQAKRKAEEEVKLAREAKAKEVEARRRANENEAKRKADAKREREREAEAKRKTEEERRLARLAEARHLHPIVSRARIVFVACALVAMMQTFDTVTNWQTNLQSCLGLGVATVTAWVFLQLWGISGFDDSQVGSARPYAPWLSGALTCTYLAEAIVNSNTASQWMMYAAFAVVAAAAAGVLQAFSTERRLYAEHVREQSKLP